MKEEKKLVPKLRFPEFQGAGEWTTKKLGSLASISTEKVGNNNCVPMSITSGVGLVSQEDKFGRVIAGDSYKNYLLLKPCDFAYNKSATKEYPEGFLTLYTGDKLAAVPNSIFTCFRVNGASPYPQYLNYLFSGNLHGQWLRNFIQVGARAHGSLSINDSDLLALPVPLPSGQSSLKEQQKIADCLSSLDELIAAQARKVDALKTHKKGLMQQLFPREAETQPRLRFPEFLSEGEWVVQKLEDLAKRGSGHTPNKSSSEYYDGGIKWVSLADSRYLDAGLISTTKIEISKQGIKNSSAVLHPAGTVLISRDAGVGKSAVMGISMAVSQHFIVWICNPSLLSNWFLYHLLQKMKPVFERIATGSTIKTIGLPFFKALCVSVPSLPEQQRIADCLTSLDTLITAAAQELETLKTHKKGFDAADVPLGGGGAGMRRDDGVRRVSVVKHWLTTASQGERYWSCRELHWPVGRSNCQGFLDSSSCKSLLTRRLAGSRFATRCIANFTNAIDRAVAEHSSVVREGRGEAL